MANYQSLKAAINAVIKANGNKEITGTVLNEMLTAMVNSLGADYQFAGVATPSTVPGNPDQKVFYIALTPGVYVNFNSIEVYAPEIAFLTYDTSWSKKACPNWYFNKFNLLVNYDVTDHYLVSNNTLSPNTHPNWHTYYRIPVKAGDFIAYLKTSGGSMLSGNSYVIVTNSSGTVLSRADATGGADVINFNYTMPSDGYVSICFYDSTTNFPSYQYCILTSKTGLNAYMQEISVIANIDCLQSFERVNYPLLKTNNLSTTANPTWPTYFQVPVRKGAVFRYNKIYQASLLTDYAYYIITDVNMQVLQKRDGEAQGETFDYTYTMPCDGYISACYNSNAGAAEVSITMPFNVFANAALYGTPFTQDQDILVNSFRSIYKFGVIGDSLSVGHMANPVDEVITYRNLPFSWPQILARANGQKCKNFGFSGASATTWFTNTQYNCPTDLSNPNNLCQVYIIGLGANPDAGGVGSMSDINWSNPEQSEATFYGQYARIIQLVRSVAPKAVIFCLTLPYPRENSSINNAIKAIASDSHVSSNCFVIDLVKANKILEDDIVGDYVSAGNYSKFYYKSHFTAPGYAMVAKLMEKAVGEFMAENSDNPVIRSIGQIPYAE